MHGKFFSLIRPAATMVVVAALLNPTWRIEIEADACVPNKLRSKTSMPPLDVVLKRFENPTRSASFPKAASILFTSAP